MAVNDFWRRLNRELTKMEISAGLRINPNFFHAAMETVIAAVAPFTAAQWITAMRASLNLATGNSAGDEFTDFITSAQSLPGTGQAKRALQRQVLTSLVAASIMANRGTKIPSNQFLTGNSLRLYYKNLILQDLGTPAGSVNAP